MGGIVGISLQKSSIRKSNPESHRDRIFTRKMYAGTEHSRGIAPNRGCGTELIIRVSERNTISMGLCK